MALYAYPGAYRKGRGAELLSTLAEGDDERGRASTREALALTGSGLAARARIAGSGDGLLVIAAALVFTTALLGLTWAEHWYAYGGHVAAGTGTDGPGRLAGGALLVGAFTILAAGPFHAVDSARKRRIAAGFTFLAVLGLWASPLGAFKYSIPSVGEFVEYLWGNVAGIYANWLISLPFAAGVTAGTWLALTALARMRPAVRTRALAAGLAAACALAVALSWTRPDLPAEYGRSAFADLGAAAFVTGVAMLLAVAASARRVSDPH
jgi:hypothetical protein